MGVGHPQRLHHLFLQIRAKRLLGQRLDDEAQHVEAEAVVPGRAGMVQQGHGAQAVQEFSPCHADGRLRASFRQHLVHGCGAAAAIDQARCMAHQVLDRDRPSGRHAIDDRFPFRVQDSYLHVGEFREVLRHRVVDQQPALLMQLQAGDRRHRLGHRGDVEDRVRPHWRAGRLVEIAISLEMDELASPGDGKHSAGKLIARGTSALISLPISASRSEEMPTDSGTARGSGGSAASAGSGTSEHPSRTK